MSQQASDIGASVSADILQQKAAIDAEVSLRSRRASSKHQSLVAIRAIVQIWRHNFRPPLVNGRRIKLDAAVKAARWKGYMERMTREFGRTFKPDHKESSEVSYISRYTKPIPFLNYKLQRKFNLDPHELTGPQRDYYLEIGGDMNIDKLSLK